MRIPGTLQKKDADELGVFLASNSIFFREKNCRDGSVGLGDHINPGAVAKYVHREDARVVFQCFFIGSGREFSGAMS
jgi:hypothetical protein